MRDIVIIANFCRDFSLNDNGRFMYLCKELSVQNHVEIITSDFSHSKKTKKPPLKHNWPFKITFLHEPGYSKNISLSRFKSHYNWGREVYKYLQGRTKPDVIYCAIPSLTAAYLSSKYCEAKNVRFVIDIQDLWPEAFKMTFNVPVLSSICFFPFKMIADVIYKRADDIFAVSSTYVDRALRVNRKCKNAETVFLGTDLSKFDRGAGEKLPFSKKNDDIWIGYCGSLSKSYDIKCVIDALEILSEKYQETPVFIVMGDGGKKVEFEEYAKEKGVRVHFLGRLDYPVMCDVLKLCDIVVNPITKGSAASIINKHGDYAASGKPVINTQESMEYRNLIETYHMGYNCMNGNAYDVAEKLNLLITDSALRHLMGKNARVCAEEKFDRSITYQSIINAIEKEL